MDFVSQKLRKDMSRMACSAPCCQAPWMLDWMSWGWNHLKAYSVSGGSCCCQLVLPLGLSAGTHLHMSSAWGFSVSHSMVAGFQESVFKRTRQKLPTFCNWPLEISVISLHSFSRSSHKPPPRFKKKAEIPPVNVKSIKGF